MPKFFRLAPPKKPNPVESDIQSAIIRWLRIKQARGRIGFFCRVNSGVTRGAGGGWVRFYQLWVSRLRPSAEKGYPDLHGIYGPKSESPGRYWALEVKRKGEKPTSEQLEFLDEVLASGAVGAVVYSLDDARRTLFFEDAIDGKS